MPLMPRLPPAADMMSLLMKRDVLTVEETKFYVAQTIEAAFAQGRVKRLREDEPDGAASTSQPRAGARAAGSGGATSLLATGSATAEKAAFKRPRLPPGLVVQAKPAVAAKGAAAAPAAAAVGAASSSSASPAAPAPTALLGLGDYDSSGSGSGSKSD